MCGIRWTVAVSRLVHHSERMQQLPLSTEILINNSQNYKWYCLSAVIWLQRSVVSKELLTKEMLPCSQTFIPYTENFYVCPLNLAVHRGGWASDMVCVSPRRHSVTSKNYITKCSEWLLFIHLNNCKLYVLLSVYLKIKGLGTNASEYITCRFPQVEIMSLLTVASNMP